MDKEYIEKQALIEAFEPERSVDWYTPWIVDKINERPTADVVEVVYGEWIRQDETFTRFMCSECGTKNHNIRWRYCPNCGAKMDEKKE